ncbi:hypothetical protein IWX90DRAFT_217820 [Phyllosticta citrichinensis]|uniref:Transmembrane protein n=1 Tax=Phyllosticta citrichinensis TaxID=1130410 RepID=A0ABR1XTY9_9PEZI
MEIFSFSPWRCEDFVVSRRSRERGLLLPACQSPPRTFLTGSGGWLAAGYSGFLNASGSEISQLTRAASFVCLLSCSFFFFSFFPFASCFFTRCLCRFRGCDCCPPLSTASSRIDALRLQTVDVESVARVGCECWGQISDSSSFLASPSNRRTDASISTP